MQKCVFGLIKLTLLCINHDLHFSARTQSGFVTIATRRETFFLDSACPNLVGGYRKMLLMSQGVFKERFVLLRDVHQTNLIDYDSVSVTLQELHRLELSFRFVVL